MKCRIMYNKARDEYSIDMLRFGFWLHVIPETYATYEKAVAGARRLIGEVDTNYQQIGEIIE